MFVVEALANVCVLLKVLFEYAFGIVVDVLMYGLIWLKVSHVMRLAAQLRLHSILCQ